MSAFIVSKAHIDYLVAAAVQYKLVSFDNTNPRFTPVGMGQHLHDTNYASVSARYNGVFALAPKYAAPSNFDCHLKKADPVQVLKAVDCYEYQACEDREWEESTAHALCTALRGEAVIRLPGYETAQWEIKQF